MGDGYKLRCKSCNKKYDLFLGVGFFYQYDYYEQMKENILNEKNINLPYDRNEIRIDGGKTVYECPECGFWEVQEALDLYTLTPEDKQGCSDDRDDDNYRIVYEYKHICPKCKAVMQKTENYSNLKCKCCNGLLEIVDIVCWD